MLSIYWGADSLVVDGYASGSQERFADVQLLKAKMYPITLHLTDGITSTTVASATEPASPTCGMIWLDIS